MWILRSCEAQHGAPFAPIESVELLLYPSKGRYALWAKSEALIENLFHEKEFPCPVSLFSFPAGMKP